MVRGSGNPKYSLVIPSQSHEQAYIAMMERWEATGDPIAPQLLSRYSQKQSKNVSYSEWLKWCEDDRTTGLALSTKIPCTLYFLIDDSGEILGGIAINHANTHRGHLHAGIVPWNRGKGLGSLMLRLALAKCRAMGMADVEIVLYQGNIGAVQTILKNGGQLTGEFCENGVWSQKYKIKLSD